MIYDFTFLHFKRLSQFRDEYSLDQIMSARMVHEPLTKLQCWYEKYYLFYFPGFQKEK